MPRIDRVVRFVLASVLTVASAACTSQSPPTAPSLSGPARTNAPAVSGSSVVGSHLISAPELLTPAACPLTISGATASPNTLWSPNHKWNDVTVSYSASDACTLASGPVCSLSVTSNEAINGLGDGNTAPDWIVVNNHLVQLRAERSGLGDGRVYTVAISCNATVLDTTTIPTTTFPVSNTQAVNVTVAHDQGKK